MKHIKKTLPVHNSFLESIGMYFILLFYLQFSGQPSPIIPALQNKSVRKEERIPSAESHVSYYTQVRFFQSTYTYLCKTVKCVKSYQVLPVCQLVHWNDQRQFLLLASLIPVKCNVQFYSKCKIFFGMSYFACVHIFCRDEHLIF